MCDELRERFDLGVPSPTVPGVSGPGGPDRVSERCQRHTPERFGTRRDEANGLEAGVFTSWRWFAVARVVEVAKRLDLAIREVYEASTGTVYVRLKRLGTRGVRVRISDHRSFKLDPREFSVRHQSPGRLDELERWLRRMIPTG